jgi:hypothetical protein
MITRRTRGLLCLVAASMVTVGCTKSGPPAASSSPMTVVASSPAPVVPPLTTARASELAANLGKGTDDGLRAAIVLPSGQPLDPAVAQQFAALGPITFDLSTFQRLDATSATVVGQVAHPPAGVPGTWTFTLVYVDSTWKLLDARPQA